MNLIPKSQFNINDDVFFFSNFVIYIDTKFWTKTHSFYFKFVPIFAFSCEKNKNLTNQKKKLSDIKTQTR